MRWQQEHGTGNEMEKNIMAHCDNEAVVAVIEGDSREEECMYLMRSLAFFLGQIQFHPVCSAYQGLPQ